MPRNRPGQEKSEEQVPGRRKSRKKNREAASHETAAPTSPPAGGGLARVRPEVTPAKRASAYAGLSEDARHELAIQEIREAWGRTTSGVLTMGRVVVDACFDSDERAAIGENAEKNPRFIRLLRSLGTLEGGPSEKALRLAVGVAAYSKLVEGPYWKVVPYAHKEILVRLKDPPKMEEGANHAVKYSWTLRQTEKWVEEQRANSDTPVVKRGRTLGSTAKACESIADAADDKSLERLAAAYGKLGAPQRRQVRQALEKATAGLARIRRKLDHADE